MYQYLKKKSGFNMNLVLIQILKMALQPINFTHEIIDQFCSELIEILYNLSSILSGIEISFL